MDLLVTMPTICYCRNRNIKEHVVCSNYKDRYKCRRKQGSLVCTQLNIDLWGYDNANNDTSQLESDVRRLFAANPTVVEQFTKNSAGDEDDLIKTVLESYLGNAKARNKSKFKKDAKAKQENNEALTTEEEVHLSYTTTTDNHKEALIPLFKQYSEGNAEPVSDYLRNCHSSQVTKPYQQERLTSILGYIVEGNPGIGGTTDDLQVDKFDNADSTNDPFSNSGFFYDTDSRNNMNRLLHHLSPDMTVKMMQALLLATTIPTTLRVLSFTDGHTNYQSGLFRIQHTMTDSQMVGSLIMVCHGLQGRANLASQHRVGTRNTTPVYAARVRYGFSNPTKDGFSTPTKSHIVYSGIQCNDKERTKRMAIEKQSNRKSRTMI
jgi:hypothetical protein